MPALNFGLTLRFSPKPSASPSHQAVQQSATSGPKLIATDGPRILAKRNGFTKPQHADAYEAMLKPELLPGIGRVKGYISSYLFRRESEDEVEFVTMMFWESLDAIRAVTGPDYQTAVVPEERKEHLTRYDKESQHFEVVSSHLADYP